VFQESLLGRNSAPLKGLDSANFKVKKKKKKSKKKRKMDDELSRSCADGVAISTVLDRQREEVETTDAACKAVFETAELLENILIHLPPREIFKVQRVSRRFRDTSVNSILLRQKMFLRLRSRPTLWRLPRTLHIVTQKKRHRHVVTPVVLSPFLKSWGYGQFEEDGQTVVKFPVNPLTGQPQPFSMDSSILNTYFCDPPCRDVQLNLDYRIGDFRIRTCHDVSVLEGSGHPPTLRAAIESSLDTRITLDQQPAFKRFCFPLKKLIMTIGDAIEAIEAQTGETVSIHPDPRGIVLRGEGIADNEEWAANGEAPWAGAKQLARRKDRTAGSLIHTTVNMEYLFVSTLIRS
jgi:hypothetical protein